MRILTWLFGHPSVDDSVSGDLFSTVIQPLDVNPSTGLPMMDDAFDVMGNGYGFGEPGGWIDSALGGTMDPMGDW